VNAGGDLRCHGLDLPIVLRDERGAGVQPWAMLRDGAMATSYFGEGARSQLSGAGPHPAPQAHLSVAAPRAASADALTKVMALLGPQRQDVWVRDLLARHGAQVWFHAH
jgi:thiamine biosynthesis lipoprotein